MRIFWGRIVLGGWLSVIAAGCATTPGSGPFPYATHSIRNVRYFLLSEMCDQERVAWDHDPLSQVVILKKDGREVKLMFGGSQALVDGALVGLSGPVLLKDGAVLAPVDVRGFFQAQECKIILPPVTGPVRLRHVRTVILDAGHGGKDPGAIGRGDVREKDIVIDVVRRVRNELEACGLKVFLTRDDDTFIPLPDRSAIANRRKADIFVSVHANANHSRWIEGFEVYYLTEAVDDDARALAAAENAPAGLDDDFFKVQAQTLRALLWDLVYTENRRESVELAHAISRAVTGKMGMKLLGVKGAPFAVLKGAKMPAVLVEVGYLSNRDGLRKLKDPSYRQRMAQAIAAGIMDFKVYAETSVPATRGDERG